MAVGTSLTNISTGASDPLWSPDGKWIAFSSDVYPECNGDDPLQQGELLNVGRRTAQGATWPTNCSIAIGPHGKMARARHTFNC